MNRVPKLIKIGQDLSDQCYTESSLCCLNWWKQKRERETGSTCAHLIRLAALYFPFGNPTKPTLLSCPTHLMPHNFSIRGPLSLHMSTCPATLLYRDTNARWHRHTVSISAAILIYGKPSNEYCINHFGSNPTSPSSRKLRNIYRRDSLSAAESFISLGRAK